MTHAVTPKRFDVLISKLNDLTLNVYLLKSWLILLLCQLHDSILKVINMPDKFGLYLYSFILQWVFSWTRLSPEAKMKLKMERAHPEHSKLKTDWMVVKPCGSGQAYHSHYHKEKAFVPALGTLNITWNINNNVYAKSQYKIHSLKQTKILIRSYA